VLSAAEPEDAWSRRVRMARAEKDHAKRRAALEQLAVSTDVANVPALALTCLAGLLEKVKAHARATQLLRRAQAQSLARLDAQAKVNSLRAVSPGRNPVTSVSDPTPGIPRGEPCLLRSPRPPRAEPSRQRAEV
jgi:hypothetical protein